MTILHVGQVLFSSRYFTRQLLQTGRHTARHAPSMISIMGALFSYLLGFKKVKLFGERGFWTM
jgi:hypothetical protein